MGKNDFITTSDLIRELGKAGVLQRPNVFPFYYELSIANGSSATIRFSEMQNNLLQGFTIESDGDLTVTSNLINFLAGSSDLTLSGSFKMDVPNGSIFPVDFVPYIKYNNTSGATRILAFFGWLAPYPREYGGFP